LTSMRVSIASRIQWGWPGVGVVHWHGLIEMSAASCEGERACTSFDFVSYHSFSLTICLSLISSVHGGRRPCLGSVYNQSSRPASTSTARPDGQPLLAVVTTLPNSNIRLQIFVPENDFPPSIRTPSVCTCQRPRPCCQRSAPPGLMPKVPYTPLLGDEDLLVG